MSEKLRLRGRYLFASGKVEVEVLERCEFHTEFGGNTHPRGTPDCLFFGEESVISSSERMELTYAGISEIDNLRDYYIGPIGSTGIISLEAWDKLKAVTREHNEWIDAGRPGRTK